MKLHLTIDEVEIALAHYLVDRGWGDGDTWFDFNWDAFDGNDSFVLVEFKSDLESGLE